MSACSPISSAARAATPARSPTPNPSRWRKPSTNVSTTSVTCTTSASNRSRNPYMATLIKERRIVADSWHLLERGSKGELPEVPARGDVIVPLALWLARREDFLAYPGKLGVWIDANEGPEALAGDVQRFPLIAVNFPKFGDGRGYSIARLLRERYRYKGQLRAIGDVLHDHLDFME